MHAGSWPFVGRDDELALTHDALAEGACVVITGAAGVGKTRLAREVVAGAARAGARTEWVSATRSAASVPLGAVARLVPPEALGGGRESTLRAIVAALARESDGRLLLGIDDAHLLDDASAALVHLLVSGGTAQAVVTIRTGEPAPDSITALWKDAQAPLVVLQPLARPEVETLLTDVLDGPVDGAAVHAIWESTRGNALFLHELVLDGIESGALRCDRDLWRWSGPVEPGERLHDLVTIRTARLDDRERAALELLAVGEPLGTECVRTLGIGHAGERLERRGIVRTAGVHDDREVRLAHPIFGEVVRARVPPTRVDEIRRQLADALQAGGELDPADVLRVGLWRAESGDRDHPELLRAAARRARELGDGPTAELLARAALEAEPNLEAGYLLGAALSAQGRPQEALDAWSTVARLPGSDLVRAAIAGDEAGVLAYQLDRVADAEAVLRAAHERIRDRGARAAVEGSLALLHATHPAAGRAAPDASTGTATDPAAGPTAALAAAMEWVGNGQLELAERTALEALRSAGSGYELPTVAMHLRMMRTWALLLSGAAGDAEAEATARYEEAVHQHAELARARWAFGRGVFAVSRGHPRTALRALREAVPVFEAADMGFLRPTRAYLAMAAALSGDGDAAAAHLGAIESGAPGIDRLFGVDIARAGAWVHAARGELTAAAEAATGAATVGMANEQWAFEACARHDVVRFGGARAAAGRLEELAPIVDGPLVDAFARHARGLAAGDGAMLDATATTFAELGFDLFAAEAASAASLAHGRAGRKASAFSSAERARELVARCEGARTPMLERAGQPPELTTREREVAELAATGLASKAIAGRLGIKARTVDNLLGRVYSKLGVAGRLELGELLRSETEGADS